MVWRSYPARSKWLAKVWRNVCGETPLGDAGARCGLFDGTLNMGFMEMIAPLLPQLWNEVAQLRALQGHWPGLKTAWMNQQENPLVAGSRWPIFPNGKIDRSA